MHSLSMPVKALALTIALSFSGQAFANVATTPATPSVEAPVEASTCSTVDVVVEAIFAEHPEADIVNIITTPTENAVVFTSEKQPADLVAHFDVNGCLVGFSEIPKTTGV